MTQKQYRDSNGRFAKKPELGYDLFLFGMVTGVAIAAAILMIALIFFPPACSDQTAYAEGKEAGIQEGEDMGYLEGYNDCLLDQFSECKTYPVINHNYVTGEKRFSNITFCGV